MKRSRLKWGIIFSKHEGRLEKLECNGGKQQGTEIDGRIYTRNAGLKGHYH